MTTLIFNYSLLSHGPCSSLHKFCQLDIFCRQPPTVVGWQGYLDSAVNVKPFWVMIHFLRHESHTSHKTKSLVEILELELFVNGITSLNFCPARFLQGLKFCFLLLSCKFGGFWWSLQSRQRTAGHDWLPLKLKKRSVANSRVPMKLLFYKSLHYHMNIAREYQLETGLLGKEQGRGLLFLHMLSSRGITLINITGKSYTHGVLQRGIPLFVDWFWL